MRQIRRNFICVIAIVMMASIMTPTFNQLTVSASNIEVEVNGVRVNFEDQGPINVDGRTLVPVRGVFEMLGFNVGWNGEVQQVTLFNDEHVVILTIGSDAFTTNDITHRLDVPAQAINGRTMLLIRAVLESIGYYVGWNSATNTVIISSYPIEIAVAIAADEDEITPEEIPVGLTIEDVYWARALISAERSSFAIQSNGGLFSWGNNWQGQLGNGTRFGRDVPMRILHYMIAVSAGRDHTAAIASDNSLWAWGSNLHGQLGNGGFANQNSPREVLQGVIYQWLVGA